jgi:solute carrier family 66, member 2
VAELVLSPITPLYNLYYPLIGYVGLSVEATLPLPQIMINETSRSCKGFRLSVLLTWLAGDAMKMSWFFTATTEIPWAFKLCGIFQACCDCFLGIQYLRFGEGETGSVKEHPLEAYPAGVPRPTVVRMSSADFGSALPERRTP